MYAVKPAIITLLGALPFLAAASPIDVTPVPRDVLAKLAIVNLYSGSTCGGNTESFSLAAGYICHVVGSPKASIQVTEKEADSGISDL
ncbi:hypothetical protein F4859DRAFT_515761 [Xylaria cf. heliscus]|nr:hypothetical protein F4859DRAFT_515761 [Xylaria cf. heliscus]